MKYLKTSNGNLISPGSFTFSKDGNLVKLFPNSGTWLRADNLKVEDIDVQIATKPEVDAILARRGWTDVQTTNPVEEVTE